MTLRPSFVYINCIMLRVQRCKVFSTNNFGYNVGIRGRTTETKDLNLWIMSRFVLLIKLPNTRINF